MIGALLMLALAAAQAPPAETAVFRLDHGASPMPSFTLTLQADGSAVYDASFPPEPPKYSPYAATLPVEPPTRVSQAVTLSPAGTDQIFERLRSTHGLRGGCASRARNIADTGAKTLTYVSAAGTATCTYNYTEDKTIAWLTREFEAIAETLDQGRRIERDHRYDRLALDADMKRLVDAVRDGDALEVGTIASILQSVVDDPQVLERVRASAQELLAQAAAKP